VSGLLILGGGGHGRVVADAAAAGGGWDEIAFADDGYPDRREVLGLSVVGTFEDVLQGSSPRQASTTDQSNSLGPLRERFPQAVVAVGVNRRRLELIEAMQRMGFALPLVVHPQAWMSPFADVRGGTVILAGAAVNPGAVVGRGCIINTGATVDHDCRLADGVHLSPGVHLGGNVSIGSCTWVGIGASVRHGVTIGSSVMVGAGAAVVSDLPDGITAIGVPARF